MTSKKQLHLLLKIPPFFPGTGGAEHRELASAAVPLKLVARLFTDAWSLNTAEVASDSASRGTTPTIPDDWAELERCGKNDELWSAMK